MWHNVAAGPGPAFLINVAAGPGPAFLIKVAGL